MDLYPPANYPGAQAQTADEYERVLRLHQYKRLAQGGLTPRQMAHAEFVRWLYRKEALHS